MLIEPGNRSQHYPTLCSQAGDRVRAVTIADVGCGFGGLLVQLATTFPDQLALGMEIRDKVGLAAPVCRSLQRTRSAHCIRRSRST